jgi:hypothetical protein
MLSIPAKDVELNVEERQEVSVNDLRPLSVVNHVIDNGLEIIDCVDAEVPDQVLLGSPLLFGNKNSLEPCPDGCQH